MTATYSSRAVKRLTFYIPERDRFDNPIPNLAYWISEAILLLTSFGSGTTKLSGEGAWVITQTGKLQREPVNILYSDVGPTDFNAKRQSVLDFMERFGTATGQDTVAAEYDGEMHFIQIVHEQKTKEA